MQKWIFSLLIVSLVLFTFGCKSHELKLKEQGVMQLSQSDLQKMFSTPVSMKFTTATQVSGTQHFKPDGTTSVAFGSKSDTGNYRIANGQYCSSWDNIRTGESCWNVYRISDDEIHFVKKSGALHAKAYIQ